MAQIFVKDKTILIMALPIESQGLFESAGIPVNYCGIGKVNAAFKATQLFYETKCDTILNLGTAGSHKFPTHTMLEVSGFVQKDMDVTPLGFPLGDTPMEEDKRWKGFIEGTNLFPELKKGICGTGDVFEVGKPKLECDMADMEAYAMAKVCKKLGINFVSVKYISDGSDHQSASDWEPNLKKAATALKEWYLLTFRNPAHQR